MTEKQREKLQDYLEELKIQLTAMESVNTSNSSGKLLRLKAEIKGLEDLLGY